MFYIPMSFILYMIIDLFFSFSGILKVTRNNVSFVQFLDVLQKCFQWLQAFVHEQGSPHAQLHLAARAAQQEEEMTKAIMYLLLPHVGEVKGQPFQHLSVTGGSGAQGQQGKGSGDADWGKENILARFLGGCLPVKPESKVCVAGDYPLAGLKRISLMEMLLLGLSFLDLAIVVIGLGQAVDREVKHSHHQAQRQGGLHHPLHLQCGQRVKWP